MKLHRVKTPTLKPAYIAALLPTGVAINYAGSLLRNMLGVPLFLDSGGTLLVTFIAGPWMGVVCSILQACKIGNVTPASSGQSYEMYAIASVVLAGVSMAGGKGNMLGVIFGALSYTTINFIIVSIPGLSVDIQDTFQGLVLIIVILIQTAGPAIKESFQRSRKRRLASAKAE